MNGQGGRGDRVRLSLRSIAQIQAQLPPLGQAWLSDAEQQRLQGLTSASRRAQFLAGHWLARQCLADWLGGAWTDYAVSAAEDAPPSLLAGPQGVDWRSVHLSLSHSGDWIACALGRHAVGVDVEDTRKPRDFAALASWMHAEQALAGFDALPPEQQRAAFYVHWTLKEAWVKQAGATAARGGMRAAHFLAGPGPASARVGQNDDMGVTLAVYPGAAAQIDLCDPQLAAMRWSDWACTPPR